MLRQSTPSTVATIGIDIGKNIFHLVGLDQRSKVAHRLLSRADAGRGSRSRPLSSALVSIWYRLYS